MNTPTKWNVMLSIAVSVFTFLSSGTVFAEEINIATVEVSNRGFIDEDGLIQGSSYDIVNAIVEKAGFTYQNTLMPFPRILHSLETGTVDIALLVPNEKVNRVAIPLTYIQDVNFILVGKNEANIQQLEDIEGTTMGYLRLTPTAEKLLEHLDVQGHEGNKYAHLLQMLLHDRIDVLFGPKTNIFWALKQLNFSPKTLGQPLSLYKLEMHLVYSKKTADHTKIAALKAAAETLKQENVIQEILKKYDYSLSR